jgi:nitrogen regulatory protein PII
MIENPILDKIVPPRPKEEKASQPYEKSHKLEAVDYFVSVVPDGQASAIAKELIANNAALALLTHGQGTATSDFYEVLGLGENKKQIVMSLIADRSWPELKKSLKARFAISDYTKGIAFIIRIDSLCGVSVYKMLTDTRGTNLASSEKGGEKVKEEIVKKSNYEVVMVIVNDGFTDLVMDAAKKAGARGGTILAARGTGNKDIEKFFGVVITPEKQIVMILVPKKIKDQVIANIYKEVGINTKGQGIAFSMPASDVVGIVPNQEEEETEEAKNEQ